MVEAIAIGVFVFVVVYVGGSRIMAHVEQRRIIKARLARIVAAPEAKGSEYTGPRFNVHGREID